MEPIIKLENVGVAYDLGKSNEVWAVKNVSLEIYPEEYIVFFGPSGCGKSTLLYAIAGLEKPDKGNVIVNGKNIHNLPEKDLIAFHRSSIGMVFQAYYLIASLSARDNILLPQIFAKVSPKKRVQRANLLMEKFGVLDFQKRRPSQLSGGQQQRIAITRSLINDPAIVLADEPVGNLDSKNAEIVVNLLMDLNQKDKKTIIHVTHDPRYLRCASRTFYMKDGEIVRVVANPERKGLIDFSEQKISELERLAQAYPYLTETRLRAKLILYHLILPYTIETQEKIEETIDKYILKKITEEELRETLDKPPIGLYTQTAQDLTKKISVLSGEMEAIQEEEYPGLTPIEERSMSLRGYLLDSYTGTLSFEQIKRLEDIIAQRVVGKIGKKSFQKVLDTSFAKGGVGLNVRTAARFTREIELILMKK